MPGMTPVLRFLQDRFPVEKLPMLYGLRFGPHGKLFGGHSATSFITAAKAMARQGRSLFATEV
jgi:hypothetical protein